ncbi:ROK family protein [Nocardioides marmoraquaticus]
MRQHNLATLLGHVHHTGGASRAWLTEQMGLNRSTIGDLVRELDELGLVDQVAPDTSNGTRASAGRPSLDVVPVASGTYVLATEVGVDVVRMARVGLGGEVLDRLSRPTPPAPEPDAVVDLLVDLAHDLDARGGPDGRLVGAGLAVPGVVNDADGIVRFAPNLGWSDVDLRAVLGDRLGPTRLHLGNDAELGALAEHTRGVGRGRSHLVFLSADVGVGGGIIVDGRPMRGASGYAGEVGHQRFDGGTQRCRCGNDGCWETEIGSHAVAEAVGCPESQLHLLEEYLRPGTPPTEALQRVGRHLGVGLGGLVNVFNPELVILGGVLRWVYPNVRDAVHRELETWALPAAAQEAEVALPGLGGDSVLVGAAELAFSDLLADPTAVLARAQRAGSGLLPL